MGFLYFVGFVLLCYLSVCFRLAVSHPIKVIKYGVIDFAKWLRYKRWRECKTGRLIAYVGLFGKGKTLTAVHHVVSAYNKYNDKKIYDFHRKKWVTQKIYILSNVDLTLPHKKFEGLAQMVSISEK